MPSNVLIIAPFESLYTWKHYIAFRGPNCAYHQPDVRRGKVKEAKVWGFLWSFIQHEKRKSSIRLQRFFYQWSVLDRGIQKLFSDFKNKLNSFILALWVCLSFFELEGSGSLRCQTKKNKKRIINWRQRSATWGSTATCGSFVPLLKKKANSFDK